MAEYIPSLPRSSHYLRWGPSMSYSPEDSKRFDSREDAFAHALGLYISGKAAWIVYFSPDENVGKHWLHHSPVQWTPTRG